MSNLAICIAFAAGKWANYQTIDNLFQAVQAQSDDLIPGGELTLTDPEKAVLERAILTAGATVAIDVERIGAEAAGSSRLKIYDHEGLIVDAETLVDRGVDLTTCSEVIMVENHWLSTGFIRENMDPAVHAQIKTMIWPDALLEAQMYMHLHRAIKGQPISFYALKQAADEAADEAAAKMLDPEAEA